jgi:hypothetical protein
MRGRQSVGRRRAVPRSFLNTLAMIANLLTGEEGLDDELETLYPRTGI